MLHFLQNNVYLSTYDNYFRLTFGYLNAGLLTIEDHAPTLAQTLNKYFEIKLNEYKHQLTKSEYSKSHSSVVSLINKALQTYNLQLFIKIYEELESLTLEDAKTLPLFCKMSSLTDKQKNYLSSEFR